ncbi:MAG: hypothetical protein M3N24_04790 [Actinomycetota bacterium]|nr:hypothetical protein [Actinomycetota bacterium]
MSRARFPLGRVVIAVALLGIAAVLIVGRAGRFVTDARVLPPSPDTPWYVWRSQFLTAYPPAEVVSWRGPSGQGGGGYRVASPLLGALLLRTADVQGTSLSTLLVAGLGSLLGLALAAAAFSYRRDPLLFACVGLFAGALLFANPFLGYTDNVLALLLVTAGLTVLDTKWRGAAAAGVLIFLASLAHPPVAAVFVIAVLLAAGVGVLLKRRWKARVGLEAQAAVAAVFAAVAALGAWYLGAWGAGSSFGEGIDPANNSKQEFAARLSQWIEQLQPWIAAPLILIGVVAFLIDRGRLVESLSSRVALLWTLPLLGVAGALTQFAYPYHRFLNVTAAHLLLGGVGLWAVSTLTRRVRIQGTGRLMLRVAGVGVAAAFLAPMWLSGLRLWNSHGRGWTTYMRPPAAALSAYFEGMTNPPPVVFIAADVTSEPWNSRRGTSHRLRAALPAPLVPRAYVFVGNVRDFLAGRPTETPRLQRASRATFHDASRGMGGEPPVVLLVRQLNRTPANRQYMKPQHAVALERDLFMLRGPGLAEPNPEQLAVARVAGDEERRSVAVKRGVSVDDVRNGLRAAGAILLIAFVPGALAIRFFGRTDLASVLGLAPVLSIGLNLAVGFVILALLRSPVTSSLAWLIVGVATAAGAVMWSRPPKEAPTRLAGESPDDKADTASR